MRSLKHIAAPLVAFALPFTHGIRIIQTNDDGWAEGNLRVLNDALNAMGHQVVLSAPAENQSGRGSLDRDPQPRKDPCMYDSCPANSGPVGSNATRPDLNWVNSYPATSARYGIDSIGPKLWSGAKPELVVTGPNVGANLWLVDWVSGTVGAACYAAHDAGIPAIAFSGANTDTHPWNTPASLESAVFAEISANITQSIIDAGEPYLPKDVFLNVNMPKIVAGGSCSKASDVKYVLSRITSGIFSPPDVNWCGGSRLPSELHVHQSTPCSVSISVGDASDKTTADANAQQKVLDKLKPLLSCL
ncbi:SurE-like phosphatase/nucleotidase domain protein [Metarhizium robertsii]|uniref:Survival protein sure-likephosphatase/nucleotidase-like protein n=2 Tax=Metarhizium robertsii TaxID=568076 RepID=E9EKK3_METRA|nr:survival protein sure-likephosphatase/nucleotidase-like protein [Metarhizium robertsii ARSEF 23]EFZ03077.1 survival protein sure-likephosphatase/nucleotidase-like protein [Metarhizium robertsii ARSEF 23]EXU96659.1 SurE-like phosphatase/nucleotidase domain protein [Metarhizium robertsii]